MIPYWIMFGIVAAGALQFGHRARTVALPYLVVTLIAIALLVGLRFDVGGDWQPYLLIFEGIYFLPLGDALRQTDPGYALLNWLGAQAGTGVWFPNLACALIVMAGVGRLCLRQPNPFLALLVAVPYFVIVVAMGYTRQAAAIGLVCFAITASSPNRTLKTVAWIALAALLHKTALLMLPITLIPVLRRNVIAAAAGVLFFIVAFNLALGDTIDTMMTNYVEGSYDSQGALIRVLMNVVSAGFYLPFRRRFGFDRFETSFWTASSILSLLSLAALIVAPSTSGIDRIALFLTPLQIVVLSRLPYIVAPGRLNREVLIAVMIYCAAVQAVWLIAATHAEQWLPYRTVVGLWAFAP